MRSWPTTHVPRLPGTGRPLRLYDTATREVRPTAPGPTARMYVCGITPYDATHLGHAATYITFDLVQRVWLDGGHEVHYVQNVTDVDDPLFERAARNGEPWDVLGQREIEVFRADMAWLGVLPPREYLGAVESVPEIAAQVRRLVDGGSAYLLEDDVYFSVDADPRFGYEAGLLPPAMLELSAERGGDPQRPGKKSPLDPLLWIAERPGEPAWDSDLGRGRPGWHIECAVIAIGQLGMGIDVQGGGSDLAFPHHEMSAAHAECLTGQWPFARHYVHAGMIGLHGEKMSKSRGNLVFASRLRDAGEDPAAVRLALLTGHYRTDRPWTGELLDHARARLGRWRDAAGRGTGPAAADTVDAVRAALADDLDTPAAVAALDRWATEATTRGGRDPNAPALVRDLVDSLLGIRL
jgi:L-cysteine:1D-myo-inositol 2-amino-2-deoxy-alpha-D-glucopyranoside ligase